MSYFIFFDGPGLNPDMLGRNPNVLGLPDDDGLRLNNFVSLKYRITQRWALDFQARIQWVLNNAQDVEDSQTFRWQAPRIGVSGKIASGDQWTLTGAINTDFPYFLPEPIGGGYVTERRTTLFNPGMFAKFAYKPRGSDLVGVQPRDASCVLLQRSRCRRSAAHSRGLQRGAQA